MFFYDIIFFMKFNLIEKTAFSAVFIIFLFCVVRDYTVSHDFLITGVYGFIIGLPLVFICGLYVLIKTLVGSSDPVSKSIPDKSENLYCAAPEKKYDNSLVKKFAKFGYLTCGFVFGGIILFASIQKLFLLGILFVPIMLVVWIAAFVCAVYPLGMCISYLLSTEPKPVSIEKTQFSTDEAWGIIAYFVGLITLVLVLYNFFFNK